MVLDFGLINSQLFPVSNAAGDGMVPERITKLVWDDTGVNEQLLGSIIITSGAYFYTTATVANTSLRFDNGGTDEARMARKIPASFEGNKLKVTLLWAPTTTNTGNCYWEVDLKWGKLGEVLNNTNEDSSTIMINAASGTVNQIQSAAVWTTAATVENGDILNIIITRFGGHGSDTFTGNAHFLGMFIETSD